MKNRGRFVIRPEVYRTYWYFAAERQKVFFHKLSGDAPPYTDDPILQMYKFCNVYRATDRVSQFLIKDVIYSKPTTPADTLFRIFLFRLFNKIATWEKLEKTFGEVTLANFNPNSYSRKLREIRKAGGAIYGNAFILCANKAFGFPAKHDNHLALLERVFLKGGVARKFLQAKSLKELFKILRALPLIGDFMAYQIAIDFNYTSVINFSENDFTVAGPGALRGIHKCFADLGGYAPTDAIMHMVENQQKEFQRYGLDFQSLFGRPLQAIDCQGLFCETDKYTRVSLPDLKSNRKRIKAKYIANAMPIEYFFPPKWQLEV